MTNDLAPVDRGQALFLTVFELGSRKSKKMIPMLSDIAESRPSVDVFLCRVFKQNRLQLPSVFPEELFEGFHEQPVTLRELPRGPWSTPLSDLAVLVKIARCRSAATLLEVGSFRGYTALYLAIHTGVDARIVTVDSAPDHGEAYRGTSHASKIERRVGSTVAADLFTSDSRGTYDYIFLDAAHDYSAVKRDTELLLPLLAPTGIMLWHDYANWGYYSGINGVPEYLNELGRDLPVIHISGSDLAAYSPAWEHDQRDVFKRALEHSYAQSQDKWTTAAIRGR